MRSRVAHIDRRWRKATGDDHAEVCYRRAKCLHPHTVSLWVIGLAMLVQVGLSVLVNQVLFPREVFLPVSEVTGGFASQTLCANILMMLINIGIVIMLIGRLHLRDIGMWPTRRAWLWSIAISGGLWVCAQLTIAVAAVTAGKPVSIASSWTTANEVGHTVGRLIGQVFGNALYEETLFRGFLLIQIGLLLSHYGTQSAREESTRGRVRSWIAATLLTQMFFAVTHVPNRLMKGSYAALQDIVIDQGILLAAGLLYAVIYLGTRNLWLCVLLHALSNAPTPLLAGSGGSSAGANVIAVGLVTVFVVATVMLLRRRFLGAVSGSESLSLWP